MIGFITTKEIAQTVNDAVSRAQMDRGLPVFWLPGAYPVFHGVHVGKSFIPCDDLIMHTPLRGNPPLAPIDFPEFQAIIEELGGLDARVDIPPSDIIEE